MSENVVSTDWLAKHSVSPDVVVIDVSWHMPATKRNAQAEFAVKHIPGAVFYDLDAGSNPSTTLPHMLPSAEKFSSDMMALGVGDDSHVVVYDSVGLFSAARVWWMLKTFGHAKVSVLNGGLPKWEAEGRTLVSGIATPKTAKMFSARLDGGKVKSLKDVAEAVSSQSAQIADARSPTRFRGEEREPRPGVRPGHMLGANNVHYANLLNADSTMKSPAELQQAFEAAGIDLKQPIITSCGSGVTAAILSLALTELGVQNHSLYDGSWAEWGASEQIVAIG
jgi:thiosulfate/3-mercaptopyruvate sulfurtransferase